MGMAGTSRQRGVSLHLRHPRLIDDVPRLISDAGLESEAGEGAMVRLNRREAILGLGAAAMAAPLAASAQTFPPGAIIRTLFADVSPEFLAGGATLFHEHLSLGPDFTERFRAAAQAVLTAQGAPPTQRPAAPPP